MALPPSSFPSGLPAGFPSASPHVAADPAVLAGAAARLRGLAPTLPPQVAEVSELLGDATVPAPSPDSAIGRFLAALASASRAQQGRVAALGQYAGGAAGALEWFTGEVDDAEAASSARFGRDREVLA